MIPTNILFLIAIFIMFYVIGALLSTILLIDSFKNRKFKTAIIAMILVAIYAIFGLSLI